MEVLCEPGKPCAVVRHGSDGCLANAGRRGRGPAHRTEPAERGWAPGGLARGAEIVAQEHGCEALVGGLESAPRLCTGPPEVPEGCVRALWDRPGRAGARAPQAGQRHGLTPVGCDALPRLGRDARRGHAPAAVAFVGARAGAPIPPRSCCRDKHQRRALRPPLPDAWVDSALACPESAAVAACSRVCVRDLGDGTRGCLDLHADGERGRLWQGGPPRSCLCVGSMWRWLTASSPTVGPEVSCSSRKSLCLARLRIIGGLDRRRRRG